jgi:hypothetical protein
MSGDSGSRSTGVDARDGAVPSARYIDQIDADRDAIRWLEERALALGADRIEWHNHEYPGRSGSAWRGNTLLAITVVLRDVLNWSVLVCHEVSPRRGEPEEAPGAIN